MTTLVWRRTHRDGAARRATAHAAGRVALTGADAHPSRHATGDRTGTSRGTPSRGTRARVLHLLESPRARRVTVGALAASVVVHAVSVWAAVTPHTGGIVAATEGPISVRYLLPVNRLQEPPGERITWVALGPGTPGWVAGRDAGASPARSADAQALAQGTRRPEPADDGELAAAPIVYSEEEVDSTAVRDPESAGPTYPEALRARGVEGMAAVEFTVDTAGHPVVASFLVVEATAPEFAAAVRDALPGMRFRPAIVHGRRVSQTVRLPIRFQLQRTEAGAT